MGLRFHIIVVAFAGPLLLHLSTYPVFGVGAILPWDFSLCHIMIFRPSLCTRYQSGQGPTTWAWPSPSPLHPTHAPASAVSKPPAPTPGGLLPPLVSPRLSLGPLPSACPPPPTPTWLLLMLQIIPAVTKPLPCKWAAFQCVCVCVCMRVYRGGGLAGKAPCLCLAHCLGEFMPFPTNLWSPAQAASLHWTLALWPGG